MKTWINRTLPYILLSALFFAGGCDSSQKQDQSDADARSVPLTATEYKILLNPEKFADFTSGFEGGWNIVQDAAASEGIAIVVSELTMEVKRKDIRFFDTPDADLRKAGFSLRRRAGYVNDTMAAQFEFTLKFRRPTAEDALSADLVLAEGYTPKDSVIELESDILYYSAETGAETTVYSLANSTVLQEASFGTLREAAMVFPVLGTLGISLETVLLPVVDATVDEWKVSPGSLNFGSGLVAEVDISLWTFESEGGRTVIPELSFDHAYMADSSWDADAMKKCTTFLNVISAANPEWVIPCKSKTAILYEQR